MTRFPTHTHTQSGGRAQEVEWPDPPPAGASEKVVVLIVVVFNN